MLKLEHVAGVAIAVAVLLAGAPTVAEAQTAGKSAKPAANCINKAGQGTNTSEDGAKFQAYEAILQATDWGMWLSWMATSQKIGVAPGYKVSNLRSKCEKGKGLGHECVLQATLCK